MISRASHDNANIVGLVSQNVLLLTIIIETNINNNELWYQELVIIKVA